MNKTIIYSVPEVLLDKQIQPALDKLNTLDPGVVKCHMIHKDSMFKRDVVIEITDTDNKLIDDDLFYIGLLFGRSMGL